MLGMLVQYKEVTPGDRVVNACSAPARELRSCRALDRKCLASALPGAPKDPVEFGSASSVLTEKTSDAIGHLRM